MKVAHYYPNEFMNLWTRYAGDIQFQSACDDSTDLIYAGSASQLGPALAAKEKYGKPLVCWVWDIPWDWRSWTRNTQEVLENEHRDKTVGKYISGLKQCDLVISASEYTRNTLKKHFGIDSIQHYFYLNYEEMDAVSAPARARRVIQISRYVINKRFELTLEATAGMDVEMVFVGMGQEYYDRLLKLAQKFKPKNHLLYLNLTRYETIRLLKSSLLLVSPSVFEGWGITPLEALYCGLPVVLSDLEVFREVHEDRVLYHDIDDAEGMREQIKRLLNDTKLRNEIMEQSKGIASSFTPQRFADGWKKIVEDLA